VFRESFLDLHEGRSNLVVPVGLDQLCTVDDWIAATAVAAGGLSQAAGRAATAADRARRDLKKRDLFYLYEVNQRL